MTIHLALVDGRMRDETSTGHLTSDSLAAFVDGRLTGSERDRAVRHLAGCTECRAELTELRAVIDSWDHTSRWRWVVPALAAAAMLAIVTIPRIMGNRAADTRPTVRAENAGLPEGARSIAVVFPTDQAEVSPADLELTWRAAGVAATYTVSVLDSSGGEVWKRASLRDTSVAVPAGVHLRPGTLYFWSVDARLTDGTTAKTGALSFVIR